MQEIHKDLIDELKERDEQKEKERQERQRQLKEAVEIVFDTEAGMILGRWLYEACTMGRTKNDINPNMLSYYKRGEDIYYTLREFMTKENIINIELGGFNQCRK